MLNPESNIKFVIISNEDVNGKYDLVADDGDRHFTLALMLGKKQVQDAKGMAERTALLCGKTVIA